MSHSQPRPPVIGAPFPIISPWLDEINEALYNGTKPVVSVERAALLERSHTLLPPPLLARHLRQLVSSVSIMPAPFVKFIDFRRVQGVWDKFYLSLNSPLEDNMKDFVKYGRARDQLYHLKVAWRQLVEGIPVPRRTSELVQALEMVELVIETICKAHEANQIVALQLDVYDMVPLPGFLEQIDEEMKNPYRSDEG